LQAREYKQAAEGATKALALDPKCGQAHQIRGVSLYKLKNLDGAIADLETARKLCNAPPPTLTNCYIAKAFMAQHNLASCRSALRRENCESLAASSAATPILIKQGTALQSPSVAKLWIKLKDAEAQKQALLLLNKYGIGATTGCRVLSFDGDNQAALYLRGLVSVSQEQYSSALTDLNKLSASNVQNADYYASKGRALVKLQKHEEALKVYSAGLRLHSGDVRLRKERA
jgi:tetratricopeptide (TPR) repeat protein